MAVAHIYGCFLKKTARLQELQGFCG